MKNLNEEVVHMSLVAIDSLIHKRKRPPLALTARRPACKFYRSFGLRHSPFFRVVIMVPGIEVNVSRM